MSHDRRFLMPYYRGIPRLRVHRASTFYDMMSAPCALQPFSSMSTTQCGPLGPVAPEFLGGLLWEVPVKQRSAGPTTSASASAWNLRSRFCLAYRPESCHLRVFPTIHHEPLGQGTVLQQACKGKYKGFPASGIGAVLPTRKIRAVHSAVRRLEREGRSLGFPDAADGEMWNKLPTQTVEFGVVAVKELCAAPPGIEECGGKNKALEEVEYVEQVSSSCEIRISVPENVGVNVIDESGRVVEGWGAKAMGLLRGLLGVGETGNVSLISESKSFSEYSAADGDVCDPVLPTSKIVASTDRLILRLGTVSDAQQAAVDDVDANAALCMSEPADLTVIPENRSAWEGDAHCRAGETDNSLMISRLNIDGGEGQTVQVESTGERMVTADGKPTALLAIWAPTSADDVTVLSKNVVSVCKVGQETGHARGSKNSGLSSGAYEDEVAAGRSLPLVSVSLEGTADVLKTSHDGQTSQEEIADSSQILQTDAGLSFSRTLEKSRTAVDRRRRSAPVNRQSAVLHDLLSVPGIGPRNMEKFVAKGIVKVAELKQLYKEKFRDQQSEKMVEFLKRSIGIVHKNHAMSIASYIKDTVDGECENEDKAADGDIKIPLKRRLTFCVEGNISVGKTTFLQKIANETLELRDLVEVVPEPVGKWQDIGPDHFNILNAFYEEPQRYAYTFQNYVFVTRLMQERESAKGLKPLRLMERSVFSDRMVFVRAVHEAKWMSEMEISIYDSWFDPVVSVLPGLVPDAFIYMRASPDTCLRRLQMRKRPEEQTVTLDYLRDLHDKHEQWLFPAEKGDGRDILSVSEWPVGFHEGVPPGIKDRVFYLQGVNVHSCIQKVPALVLDCEATIDFSRDVEAKAEYAKQVAEFFKYVRRMKEREEGLRTCDKTNLVGPLVLPGRSSLLGPDGSDLRANGVQALDFRGPISSFCS